MLLWFAAFAVLVVLAVFDSPAMDYRYVVLGAVLPVLEVVLGRPLLLHTLAGSVLALVVVVLLTRGRRLVARRFVGVPIGLFLHLVADGSWANASMFWWPFLGLDALGDAKVPERAHLGLSLVLEVVGLVALVGIARAFALDGADERRRFVRTGRLVRRTGSA